MIFGNNGCGMKNKNGTSWMKNRGHLFSGSFYFDKHVFSNVYKKEIEKRKTY